MNPETIYEPKRRIVIVGGGFAGVRTALELVRQNANAEITLVDNKFHFEYHSSLYRVVTGGSVMEVCIPFDDIFKGKNVNVVEDTIDNVVPREKVVWGTSGSKYHYDYLILALGSEANYFGIPGLQEYAYSFKSTNDALKLRRHVEKLFSNLQHDTPIEEKISSANIVIVGAGATGVEIAGQIVEFAKGLAKENHLDPSFVTIDLIEAQGRVLPLLHETASTLVEARLRELGVNIFLNHVVEKDELEAIHMKTMSMDTRTVIWTAGVKAHSMYSHIEGAECNRRGCVKVTENFEIPNVPDVFIIGDGAEAQWGGMAQTAERQGKHVAKILAARILGKSEREIRYVPKEPAYAVPVGPNWAIVQWGRFTYHGILGWMLRRAVDFKYFLSILPFAKAFEAFRQGKIPCKLYDKEPLENMILSDKGTVVAEIKA
ncbi:MAG TPA: NAD(P)/FAD-dependent oxidoreductase [Candidatus Paceibacterota bacterium]|nr:NAD(P)/FAD-dependent oxidoreductase [Candidatus Paceibacterota bacterium]